MWFILGSIGSIAMVGLEAFAVTDIGYWWSILPVAIGIVLQLGLGDILGAIFD